MNTSINNSDAAWLLRGVAWVSLFLTPIHATMIAVGFLVMGDLFTGIWASIKKGEKFSSARLRRSVTKSMGYEMAIILSFVTETILVPDVPILKVVAGLIASTELVSALENLAVITGVPLGEVIKKLFNKPPGDK